MDEGRAGEEEAVALRRHFEARVAATLDRYRMWAPGETLVVGVSGGPDSVALLHALWQLAPRHGVRLHVAHLDHGLRPESAEEAAWVQAWAEQLGLPVTVERADVAACARRWRLSCEDAGRRLRYALFHRVADAVGAQRVAVGHTADDQAETVLMRFLDGSGPRGLAGIPPVRGRIIRPLIEVWRQEVEAYCRACGLTPRYDPSNGQLDYRRNRLRHHLIPLIEKAYQPSFRRAAVRVAAILRDEDAYLEELARAAYQQLTGRSAPVDPLEGVGGSLPGGAGPLTLEARPLAALPPALGRRVARLLLLTAGVRARRIEHQAIEAVLAVARGECRRWALPDGVVAERVGEHLWVGRPPGRGKAAVWGGHCRVPGSPEAGSPAGVAEGLQGAVPLQVPGRTDLPALGMAVVAAFREGMEPPDVVFSPWIALLDWERLVPPLAVRTRRPGDRLVPVGMDGHKKLQDLFVDAKVPREQRERIPLVVDQEGIVWVVGLRLAARAAANEHSRRILRLEAHQLGQEPS